MEPEHFASWWRHTPRYEGDLAAWERNPANRADRGGRTQFGITERTFAETSRAAGLAPSAAAFESLSVSEARRIAAAQWRGHGLDRVEHPGVALVVGDWVWGSNSAGIRRVQRALVALGEPVTETGELDAATLSALNGLEPRRLIDALSLARFEHHADIVRHDPTQRVFLAGWQRRTEERREEALALTDTAPVGAVGIALGALDDEAPSAPVWHERSWVGAPGFPTFVDISSTQTALGFTHSENDARARNRTRPGEAREVPHPPGAIPDGRLGIPVCYSLWP